MSIWWSRRSWRDNTTSRKIEDLNWRRSKRIKSVWKGCKDRLMANKESPLKKTVFRG